MAEFLSDRVADIQLPEREGLLRQSLGAAERELERLAGDGDYVNLTYADTRRFPAPPGVLERFIKAASAGGLTYTSYRGEPTIRRAVAENLSQFLKVAVDPDTELLVTPGSQGALFTALAATINPGDRVMVPDPDYLSYERLLRLFGATVEHIPLLWEEGKPATLDFEVMEQVLKRRPKALLMSNPNNPTGVVLDRPVLERISRLACEHDFLVIADELYSRLVYDDLEFDHIIGHPGMRERCITVLGPSKTESMSGYRVGVAVAPPEIATRMEDVLGLTVLRAPAYSQHALVGWLHDDCDYIKQRLREYGALRDEAARILGESGLFEVVKPQGTAYIFPRLVGSSVPSDQEVASALIREARAIVNPGYQFGPRGLGHIRICFAQDEEVLVDILDKIVAVVGKLMGVVRSAV